MAITANIDVIASALWPQGDIRDPLGVWGFRGSVTGNATGGGIKVTGRAQAGQAAAYVYTCYSINIHKISGTVASDWTAKIRLLTNWPNIDPQAGVQGYSTAQRSTIQGTVNFTSPIQIQSVVGIGNFDRFILLFDPRPSAGVLNLVELETAENIDTEVYGFEGYGYFWDRSVLQAPGGPRHPGAS